jgi:hypothetical protein
MSMLRLLSADSPRRKFASHICFCSILPSGLAAFRHRLCLAWRYRGEGMCRPLRLAFVIPFKVAANQVVPHRAITLLNLVQREKQPTYRTDFYRSCAAPDTRLLTMMVGQSVFPMAHAVRRGSQRSPKHEAPPVPASARRACIAHPASRPYEIALRSGSAPA